MIAGIVIDKWKLPIFTKILNEEGYEYKTVNNCPTKGSITLRVTTDDMLTMSAVVKRMDAAAARSKMN